MDRFLQGTPATISKTWYAGSIPTDPATVTIRVDRADGSSLVAAGTPTSGSGANPRTFDLTTSHTGLLDRLKVTWTSSTMGTLVDYVDVAGGFLCSAADLRALFADATAFPDATLVAARNQAEGVLEQACGVAFVPRYEREVLSGDRSTDLRLRWPRVRAVRSATVGDAALDVTALATIRPTVVGVYYPSRWAYGTSNVVVGYEHGHDFPPAGAGRAALRLAQHYLTVQGEQGFSDRVIRGQAGEEAFTFATAGVNGQFGIPDVDSFVGSHRYLVFA